MIAANPTEDGVTRLTRHATALYDCAAGLIQAGGLLSDQLPADPETLRAAEALHAACVILTGRIASDLAAIRQSG